MLHAQAGEALHLQLGWRPAGGLKAHAGGQQEMLGTGSLLPWSCAHMPRAASFAKSSGTLQVIPSAPLASTIASQHWSVRPVHPLMSSETKPASAQPPLPVGLLLQLAPVLMLLLRLLPRCWASRSSAASLSRVCCRAGSIPCGWQLGCIASQQGGALDQEPSREQGVSARRRRASFDMPMPFNMGPSLLFPDT